MKALKNIIYCLLRHKFHKRRYEIEKRRENLITLCKTNSNKKEKLMSI